MKDSKQPIYVITGATASGKSSLAIAVAEKLDGVIINADSMQIYRDLRVITARPNIEDENIVPHRLYGVMDGSEICNAAKWVQLAKNEIETVWQAGKVPILVGGTGMYLKSLIDGLSQIPETSADIRKNMRAKLADEGNKAFYDYLTKIDPLMASRLEVNDSQRCLRAAEVMEQTGKSLAMWQEIPLAPIFPNANYRMVAISRERDSLYQCINQRFEQMFELGALDEVIALKKRNLSAELPVMRAVGVPEFMAYLNGTTSLEEAIAKAQQKTRNYAKRQHTWLRGQFPNTPWLMADEMTIDEMVKIVINN